MKRAFYSYLDRYMRLEVFHAGRKKINSLEHKKKWDRLRDTKFHSFSIPIANRISFPPFFLEVTCSQILLGGFKCYSKNPSWQLLAVSVSDIAHISPRVFLFWYTGSTVHPTVNLIYFCCSLGCLFVAKTIPCCFLMRLLVKRWVRVAGQSLGFSLQYFLFAFKSSLG